MPVGRFLNDGAVPAATIGGLDRANDRFLVHDASASAAAQLPASALLNTTLSSADVSGYDAMPAIFAGGSPTTGDVIPMFDAAASSGSPRFRLWSFDDLRRYTFAAVSATWGYTRFTSASSIDGSADDFAVFDADAGRFARVRADVILSALLNVVPSHHTATPVTLNTTTDQLLVHTNYGATQIIVFNLPAATVGLRYSFSRIAGYAVRIDPNGSEVIGEGGAGLYLEMQGRGHIELRCLVAGQWEVWVDSCLWDFE